MTDMPQSVRIASIADAKNLLFHCAELFKDNFMGLSFSANRVMETVGGCCDGTKGIAGVIDGEEGQPIASTGLLWVQPVYSDVWILSEAWLFVNPQHRKGTTYGDDLFKFSQWHREQMSERLGYDVPMELTVLSFKRLKEKTRFWGRYGTHMGSLFWVGGPNAETSFEKVVN
ncbi:MAG: hypothetical protein KGL39_04580 [Patescibacteria group bacterium]|nr:hypothetical protein [Patescibacteria group bacterium]